MDWRNLLLTSLYPYKQNPDKLICIRKLGGKYIAYFTVKPDETVFVHLYIDFAKNETSILLWNRSSDAGILRGIKETVIDRRSEFDWI